MQYTIRNIPPAVDRALRALAKREGKSMNEVALRALGQALGAEDAPSRRRVLDDLAGTWREDPEFERALTDQHRVDEALWR
ncbi:MAG: hypothetical protein EXR93_00050 [Gemmatimonadetes bacterium]|nr:hypothetical protein [Gemmatimonadota bacterium]